MKKLFALAAAFAVMTPLAIMAAPAPAHPIAPPPGSQVDPSPSGDKPLTVDPKHLRTAITLTNGAKTILIVDELGNISDNPDWAGVCETIAKASETEHNWIPLAFLRAIPTAAGHPCNPVKK